MCMKIGEVFRYSRKNKDPRRMTVDGLPNYYHFTNTPGHKLARLERGINPIGRVEAIDGSRIPAILISSSPHKLGSAETPWQDFFDVDNGHIRYYGDNKKIGSDPVLAPGNKVLLEQHGVHSSPESDTRLYAVPVVFFRRVREGGRTKGNVQFQGFGIIDRVERITQFDRKNQQAFANYQFDFTVLSLANENENFDWGWISDRRDQSLSLSETTRKAPAAWRTWLKGGALAQDRVRRRVSKLLVYSSDEQRPGKNSSEDSTLREIYKFYSKSPAMKKRFEALAATVVAEIIRAGGGEYRRGWITAASADGGADFIGRLDIGQGFGRAKIVVLGQAKCESPNVPTGGNHVARTVARLRRGWLGVYVTTSYFSKAIQREIIEDRYPILLVNGFVLAQQVNTSVYEGGFAAVGDYLRHVDSEYDSSVATRDPEEILID